MLVSERKQMEMAMAEAEEIANLVAQVKANKDVLQSATIAIGGMLDKIATLSQELQDAIAAGGTDVSADIKAAADELQANTVAFTTSSATSCAQMAAGGQSAYFTPNDELQLTHAQAERERRPHVAGRRKVRRALSHECLAPDRRTLGRARLLHGRRFAATFPTSMDGLARCRPTSAIPSKA